MSNLYLLILMSMLGSVGGACFKLGSSKVSIKSILNIFNRYIIFGGIAYVASSLLNIYVLREMDYSVVLPMTSITYFWSMLIGKKVFEEKITRSKIMGVACIIIGSVFISIS